MSRTKPTFSLPENYQEYRKYFSWVPWRNFDMLAEYILWEKTYETLWKENWWLTRERVRQCIAVSARHINDFHNRIKHHETYND